MTDLIPAISQLGFPIGITIFLIYDYAKKLANIQIELVKLMNGMIEQQKDIAAVLVKLDQMEKRMYDK